MGSFDVERGVPGCLVGSSSTLTGDDVGGVPLRPVVLRSPRLIPAVALPAAFRSSVNVGTSRLNPRPGNRVFTSWSNQPFPSGSVNDAHEKYD